MIPEDVSASTKVSSGDVIAAGLFSSPQIAGLLDVDGNVLVSDLMTVPLTTAEKQALFTGLGTKMICSIVATWTTSATTSTPTFR